VEQVVADQLRNGREQVRAEQADVLVLVLVPAVHLASGLLCLQASLAMPTDVNLVGQLPADWAAETSFRAVEVRIHVPHPLADLGFRVGFDLSDLIQESFDETLHPFEGLTSLHPEQPLADVLTRLVQNSIKLGWVGFFPGLDGDRRVLECSVFPDPGIDAVEHVAVVLKLVVVFHKISGGLLPRLLSQVPRLLSLNLQLFQRSCLVISVATGILESRDSR